MESDPAQGAYFTAQSSGLPSGPDQLSYPVVKQEKESLMMISQGLTEFQGEITGVAYNLLMAGSLIAVVPVLIAAMVAQRKVVEGLTIGAVR